MSAFVFASDPDRPPPGLENAVYAIGNFDGVQILGIEGFSRKPSRSQKRLALLAQSLPSNRIPQTISRDDRWCFG